MLNKIVYILKEINTYLSKLCIYLIRFYQKYISPLKGPTCRFYPTCSEYTKQAIIRFGVFKGGILGIKRIVKCHPLNEGGYDPVYGARPLKRYIQKNVDTLVAVPFNGYLFKQWKDGVTDNPRAVVLTQDTTLSAEFEKGSLLITKPNDAERGTTSGDTTAHLNDVVTVSATAKEGFIFKYWHDGVADNPRNVTLVQDTTELIAIFLVAHTVVFEDWDKTILSTSIVADGEAA